MTDCKIHIFQFLKNELVEITLNVVVSNISKLEICIFEIEVVVAVLVTLGIYINCDFLEESWSNFTTMVLAAKYTSLNIFQKFQSISMWSVVNYIISNL